MSRTGCHALAYDYANQLVGDTCTSGAFSGLTVSNKFDRISGVVYGRTRASVHGASATVQADYGYGTYGRLGSVASGNCSATYAYVPNNDLLQTTSLTNSSSLVLKATRSWDYGVRLRSIVNTVGTSSSPFTSHSYVYDAVNRRTHATLADGSAWNYDYDDRNELTGGKRYWADFTPVAGQQFEYGYDPIGNRTGTKAGGDQNGGNLRSTPYVANSLNQYSSRKVPTATDVSGAATATATNVSVNGLAVDNRKGEYYWKELALTNTSAPSWTPVSATAIQGGTPTNTPTAYLRNSPTNEVFSYDWDGNLTQDGLWQYTWDDENRLLSVEANSNVPAGGKRRVEFTYDGGGRRATKKVYNWSTNTYVLASTTKFLHALGPREGAAGWCLLAEVDGNNNLVRSYVWGQDLGGEVEAAGGIGGLLWVTEYPSGAIHFAAFDGNGNVMGLVKTDLSTSAQYEYGPFGELVRSTGPLAAANPFRWSTKCWDQETDVIYYGHRYYSPSLGRWTNRDLIQENGGLNLYCFAGNNSPNDVDPLGKAGGSGTLTEEEAATALAGTIAFGFAAAAQLSYNNLRSAISSWNAGQIVIASHSTSAPDDDMAGELAELNADLSSAGGLHNLKPDDPECFLAGTTVLTPAGPARIGELGCGDQVISWSFSLATYVTNQVKRLLSRTVSQTLEIMVGSTSVICSPEHPFWSPGRGWLTANEVTVGTLLCSLSTGPVAVTQVKHDLGQAKVFNLSVGGDENYCVSEQQLLVHNKKNIRRSPAEGSSTQQIKQVDQVAKEVGLTGEKRKLLGRVVEKMSRMFKETLTREDIVRLAEEIKAGSITH